MPMKILYKFLPLERITYFDNELLRFTPPGALNDPYECLPALPDDLAKELLRKLKTKSAMPPIHQPGTPRNERQWLEKKYKQAIKQDRNIPKTITEIREQYYKRMTTKMNETIGILSLSRRWDISLMWSHYTASHSGFCIGFDGAHDFFQYGEIFNGEKIAVSPIIYSNKRSVVPANDLTADQAKSILLTKALEWSYEEEERSLRLLQDADEKIYASPFNVSLFRVPHSSVSEIIVGINADNKLIAKSIEFGKKHKAPVYQAEISEKNFNLSKKIIYKSI